MKYVNESITFPQNLNQVTHYKMKPNYQKCFHSFKNGNLLDLVILGLFFSTIKSNINCIITNNYKRYDLCFLLI